MWTGLQVNWGMRASQGCTLGHAHLGPPLHLAAGRNQRPRSRSRSSRRRGRATLPMQRGPPRTRTSASSGFKRCGGEQRQGPGVEGRQRQQWAVCQLAKSCLGVPLAPCGPGNCHQTAPLKPPCKSPLPGPLARPLLLGLPHEAHHPLLPSTPCHRPRSCDRAGRSHMPTPSSAPTPQLSSRSCMLGWGMGRRWLTWQWLWLGASWPAA